MFLSMTFLVLLSASAHPYLTYIRVCIVDLVLREMSTRRGRGASANVNEALHRAVADRRDRTNEYEYAQRPTGTPLPRRGPQGRLCCLGSMDGGQDRAFCSLGT
jgi:hypothetical protein